MANRNFQNPIQSLHVNPIFLQGNVVIGATGAVGTVKGAGISSIVRKGTGVYAITLQDNYYRYLAGGAGVVEGASGATVNDGSLVAGTLYRVNSVGTSDFTTSGANANVAGETFVATGVGGAGSGNVKAVAGSGIFQFEVGNVFVNQDLASGKPLLLVCRNASGAAADPAQGTIIGFWMMLRNSNIALGGE
jgi:hypothetical protein